MPDHDNPAHDPFTRHSIQCAGVELSYVDTGADAGADAVVFLHGNPTCAYLWRNIIPHLEPLARCLAPDLMGMGDSGKAPDGSYRFVDHRRHLDAWFDAVLPEGPVTLVVHDWGSALGFHWAFRHQERIKGVAYMEALVRSLTWEEWPEAARRVFQGFRSTAGEEMVLTNNVFVERVLPGSTLEGITDEAMAVYRRPYLEPGESRRPTLSWPRDIPIDGEPADVVAIVQEYADWVAQSGIPKLFINAEPGAILTGAQREFCRSWPNQQEVTVPGVHFIQEDSPKEVGAAIA
ncbi:MAG: haloalkane dehalogenase, partial [Chloroflexota bacterium]|nr:haloalkane dehalogenase [Chloroflexota bacterium]